MFWKCDGLFGWVYLGIVMVRNPMLLSPKILCKNLVNFS